MVREIDGISESRSVFPHRSREEKRRRKKGKKWGSLTRGVRLAVRRGEKSAGAGLACGLLGWAWLGWPRHVGKGEGEEREVG